MVVNSQGSISVCVTYAFREWPDKMKTILPYLITGESRPGKRYPDRSSKHLVGRNYANAQIMHKTSPMKGWWPKISGHHSLVFVQNKTYEPSFGWSRLVVYRASAVTSSALSYRYIYNIYIYTYINFTVPIVNTRVVTVGTICAKFHTANPPIEECLRYDSPRFEFFY